MYPPPCKQSLSYLSFFLLRAKLACEFAVSFLSFFLVLFLLGVTGKKKEAAARR